MGKRIEYGPVRTFTIQDLMRRWSCPYKQILTAIHDGRLEAFKVGKRIYRVTVEEVQRFEHAKSRAA